MLILAAALLSAPLSQLAEPERQQPTLHEIATFGGGVATEKRPAVLLHEATLTAAADGAVTLKLSRNGPTSLDCTPAALGLPANWREYERVELTVSADSPLELQLTLVVPRGRLTETRPIRSGERTTVVLPVADLALSAGNAPLYQLNALRLAATWTGDAPQRTLTLHALTLHPRIGEAAPVVDALGQRRNTEWPGKVRAVAELKQRAEVETKTLARLATEPGRLKLDRYGGWIGGPSFRASGFFRAEQDGNGRWWLVTPEGNAFWSIGTTGVRVGFVTDTARVAGREFLFEALPHRGDEGWFEGRHPVTSGEIELPGNVHFYRWNVFRKYGGLEAWRDRVTARFAAWGLNSIGAWSEEIMLQQQAIPHTRFLRARAAVPGVAIHNGFPDIWDPRWEAWVDAEFARETARERGNPWLIGYFVDNEAHWSDMKLLDHPAHAKLRTAWRDFARARYGTVHRFNAEWKTACATWDDVEALRHASVPAEGPARAAMQAFESEYADRYAATVRRLLRQHDPDHLYLGCRFVRVPPHEGIVAAVGRHVDVLSVNCYSRTPDPAAFAAWHRMSGGRPIILGEFHFPLASPRQIPPPWQAFPEAEREAMFVEFIRVWAAQPWSVGAHWYQHADQPPTGRHTDGENQTVGFVDITDTPYDHLVRAARTATARMYEWHRAAQ